MPPLGSIFRSGTSRPKVDQHSLFTSIQVSVPVLQGTLQIYEPWKKKRVKARACHVTLYANDTSPFLVWSKTPNPTSGKSPVSPTSHSVTGPANAEAVGNKPRCVLPVSRAKVTKTTGGCFEVVDFATSSLFRFVAPTIRESEMWVERLKTESQREANLDMGSICSNCSSSSSSHPSPGSNEYGGFFSSSPSTPTAFHRSGYHMAAARENSFRDTSSSASDSANFVHDLGIDDETDSSFRVERPSDLPVFGDESEYGANASETFPRAKVVKQRHTRAQPHLGANLHTVDKHRPDLGNLLRNTNQSHVTESEGRSKLPFSEYFVNLPST